MKLLKEDSSRNLFWGICFKWLSSETQRDEEGYIYFDYKDFFRFTYGKDYKADINSFDMFKDLGMINSIWVAKDEKIKVSHFEEIYDFRDYYKMFTMKRMRKFINKETGKSRVCGILIKPGVLLEDFLVTYKHALKENMMKTRPLAKVEIEENHLEKYQKELINLLQTLNLNNQQAATKIGISAPTLSKFINNPSIISEKSFNKIQEWVNQHINDQNT